MAKSKAEIPTAQRAYTLRLRGPDKTDNSWRDALWATHEAVNKGAKAFGDWLLTLRGGLDHALIELSVAQPKKGGKDQSSRLPTDREKRGRRIVLALSWLSVESQDGAPPDEYRVARDKTVGALREILCARGLNEGEVQQWVADCTRSLSGRIRDDACWVNRSKFFDKLSASGDKSNTREDARKVLWHLFGKDYLTLPIKEGKTTKKQASETDPNATSDEDNAEENRGAVIQSGKGAGQRTRHLFSHVFGSKKDSKGFGKPAAKLALREWWQEQLKPQVCKCGIPLSETTDKKSKDTRSPTELHREMLSKAAARLAQIHTKQKQQEVERQNREAADEELCRIENLSEYSTALDRLNQFFENRTPRLRQIEQWDRVVMEWARISEIDEDAAEEARIQAAKRLQDELRDEKFGDINLFIAIARKEHKPVWWHNSKADTSILRTYIKGRKARLDAERLKVASYRHPDPFNNPVFCQFGVSRPHIEFGRLAPIKSNDAAAQDTRAIELLLWDGQRAAHKIFFAASKRLDREIGSASDTGDEGTAKLPLVVRRSRLGMSTILNPDSTRVRVGGVFDPKEVNSRDIDNSDEAQEATLKEASWNGTLYVDRRGLQKCAGKQGTGRHRLHWSLIVSLGLESRGLWCDYVRNRSDLVKPDEIYDRDLKQKIWALAPKKSKDTWRGSAYPFTHSANMDRCGTMSYHTLSRLPDLRLLSVDLGHRFAAACAVWETLTEKRLKREIDGRKIIAGGTSPNDLYLHTQHSGSDHKPRTTIYRRTGPDMWARLDRQFLIKLQGEDVWLNKQGRRMTAPRAASNAEMTFVRALETELNYQRNEKTNPLPRRVDELMSEAVRTVRLALQRHAHYARIAFRWTHKEVNRAIVGLEDIPANDRVEHLSEILTLWYDLASSAKWTDTWALNLWNAKVLPLILQAPFTEPSPLEGDDAKDKKKIQHRTEKIKRWQGVWATLHKQLVRRKLEEEEQEEKSERKTNREAIESLLAPVADALRINLSLRKQLQQEWNGEWHQRNGQCESNGQPIKPLTGWYKRLRDLRDWILPRGLSKPRKSKMTETSGQKKDRLARLAAARHVGGLSLTRIATIRSLWQVHKAFRYRPTPENTRVGIKLIECDAVKGRKFGDRMLQTMEHMREQRVKQLASRIVEAALGIGSENKIKHWENTTKRPRARIAEDRFAPCHAVVIENLTNYRPEEIRTRRENRQLMIWSSSKVKKYLSEGCQLHGLHLREISPAYTSRQDSRTGAPGIRCEDVAADKFKTARHWRSRVKQAADKNDAESQLLQDIEKNLDGKKVLRLPAKGGDLFVSINGRTLQADLNAAANIGLRALLDPDWPAKWWYIPCQTDTGKPVTDKVKGSAAVPDLSLNGESSPKSKKDKKDVINLWRDCSHDPLKAGQFKIYDHYWNGVKICVVNHLYGHNGIPHLTPGEHTGGIAEDTPF